MDINYFILTVTHRDINFLPINIKGIAEEVEEEGCIYRYHT